MSFSLVIAAALSIASSRSQPVSREGDTSSSPEQIMTTQAMRHVDIHKGIDLRTTVFVLGYLTVFVAVVKDGRVLMPLPLLIATGAVGFIGLTCCGMSLWVRLAGLISRSPEEVLRDARSGSDRQWLLAKEVSKLETITFRKGRWSNAALVVLIITAMPLMISMLLA